MGHRARHGEVGGHLGRPTAAAAARSTSSATSGLELVDRHQAAGHLGVDPLLVALDEQVEQSAAPHRRRGPPPARGGRARGSGPPGAWGSSRSGSSTMKERSVGPHVEAAPHQAGHGVEADLQLGVVVDRLPGIERRGRVTAADLATRVRHPPPELGGTRRAESQCPASGVGGQSTWRAKRPFEIALDHPLLLGGEVEVFPGEAGRQALLGLQVVERPPPGAAAASGCVLGLGAGSVSSSGPGAGPPARSRSTASTGQPESPDQAAEGELLDSARVRPARSAARWPATRRPGRPPPAGSSRGPGADP